MTDSHLRPHLPRRGYLGFGVDARPASPDLAHECPERWIVSEVDADHAFSVPPGNSWDGNSDDSGLALAPGDDLVAINGSRILTLADLRARAASVTPGEIVRITVLRAQQALEISRRSLAMPLESLRAGQVNLDEVPWRYQGETFRLRAIWTSPHGPTRAVVWLLPSAAWVTQECPLDPEDPTFQLIDALTEAGIATLRVDRSGLGDSEGPGAASLDFETELSMWSAGMGYFLEQTMNQRRCLFGRSLGGILAPLVSQGHAIDAICVLGASSLGWHEAMLESIEHQHRVRQDAEEKIQLSLSKVERLQRSVYLEGRTPAEARNEQPDLSDVLVGDLAGNLVYDRVASFFQQLAQVDIAACWAQFSGELLALHSEYDIIVPEIAVRRLAQAASGASQFRALPGVDHFMHVRGSLREAVTVPWGGVFSRETAHTICGFLLGEDVGSAR